jgi:hypothetical protein
VVLALAFEPIFVYISLGVTAVIVVARLLLNWALDH